MHPISHTNSRSIKTHNTGIKIHKSNQWLDQCLKSPTKNEINQPENCLRAVACKVQL